MEQMQDDEMLVTRSEWPMRKRGAFSIASFNTLRHQYRFNENDWSSEEHKSWAHRQELHRKLFIETLERPSIICLQEAELRTMEEDFPFLFEGDYGHVSAGKGKDDGHSFTKPTTFYRLDTFDLIWSNSRSRVVLAELMLKSNRDRSIYVVNVHLSGGNQEGKQFQREQQIKSALKFLTPRLKANTKEDCVIVCGDFNCDVSGAKDHNVTKLLSDFNPAYRKNDSMPFTHKWGCHEGRMFFQFIDQIFATASSLQLVSTRSPFDGEEWDSLLQPGLGFPNACHPSDHVPLVAEYDFK